MRQLTFGDLAQDRSNNFDFLRFVLAVLVIFAHSFSLLHPEKITEPLYRITNSQMGFAYISVNFFFVISGFLITASWIRSQGPWDFLRKRVLRIYPAVAVMSLFCLFVVGPLSVQNVSAYFHELPIQTYLTRLLRFRLPDQPGVFSGLPQPNEVNGSLWTIFYEFSCYFLIAVLGLAGAYRKRGLSLALFVFAFSAYIWQGYFTMPFLAGGKGVIGVMLSPAWPRFVTYFTAGMVFYLYRDIIPFSKKVLALSLLVMLMSLYAGMKIALPIMGSYILLHTAHNPSIRLQNFACRGDFSYGLYVYAFPIQQLLIQYGLYYQVPYLSPVTLFLCSTPITLVLAVLSWHFVEKPCLRLKGRTASLQERGRVAVPKLGSCADGASQIIKSSSMILHSFDYPPNHGGVSRLCAEIATGMDRMGEGVRVLTQSSGIAKGSRVPEVSEVRVTPRRPWRELQALNLLREGGRGQPVVCGAWYPEGLIATLAAARPRVILAHGSELLPTRSRWRRGLWQRLQRNVLTSADLVVTNSEYTRRLVLSSAPESRAVAIPLAVDDFRFSPGDRSVCRAKWGLSDQLVLCSVSRLHAYKGHEIVFQGAGGPACL